MLEEELRSAAINGNAEEIASLIKQGAKFAPDPSGKNPLHLAAAAGHVEIVNLLINSKNVNSIDGVGRSALQVASSGGHVDIINVLIKHGANVNSRDTLYGNTALHEASWHGFSQTVAILAKAEAKLDVTNSAGFAALHLCCQNGHNQSCRELLLAGASPDVQNNYGDTALHTSGRYGHAGVARILISANCKISEQNKNGDTALHISAAMGRRKLTTILLESNCDISVKNKQNETALDIATRKDLNEIIILIQTIKPQKNKTNKIKSSETSDSDKRSKEDKRKSSESSRSTTPWSPYGCHYYPDFSAFPQPRLDSLPNEPLGKGEQYFLDLAGNICKGPVGVGLTCHCAGFLRDMETRMEKNNIELRQKLKRTKYKLEERVEKAEGLLVEWLSSQSPVEIKRKVNKIQKERKLNSKSKAKSLDLLCDKKSENEVNKLSKQIQHVVTFEKQNISNNMDDLVIENADVTVNNNKNDETNVNLVIGNNNNISNNRETTNLNLSDEKLPTKEIENLPYRSRTGVYSPSYSGKIHFTNFKLSN